MKRISLVLVVALASCKGTPAKQYYDANLAFTAAVDALKAFRSSGKIDDENYRKLTPIIHAVDAALDSWYEAIKATPEGETPNVPRTVVNAVVDGLNALLVWQAKFSSGRNQ